MFLKIDLRDIDLQVIIYQGNDKKEIEIIKRQYEGLFYDYLVVLDKAVFLERDGGELKFLSTNCDSVIIRYGTPLERLASKYGPNVYTLGDEAIPDEELREAIRFILYP